VAANGRALFTAADLRRLAHAQPQAVLVLGPGDLITSEAVDVARELGVSLVRSGDGRAPAFPSAALVPNALPPLKVVAGAGVALEAFGVGLATPGTQVGLKDVITSADGSPLAAGYMQLDAAAGQGGALPWTLSYDEIDVVLAGELVITRGAEVVRGGPGDVLFIPKGSTITFGTPSHARFVYVAFPADWNSAAQ
jgi:ethanolamine utilization protein EutQ